jgi:hypothetical protein
MHSSNAAFASRHLPTLLKYRFANLFPVWCRNSRWPWALQYLLYLAFASAVVADALIASSLCIMLAKKRTGFRKFDLFLYFTRRIAQLIALAELTLLSMS